MLARLAAPAVALLAVAACTAAPSAVPDVPVAIATGGPGGAFYPIGTALASLYAEQLPGVRTEILTGGSSENVRAVEGGRATIGFTQADVAYVAYRRGTENDPRPYATLRGIALLWINTVHGVVPRDSAIRDWPDLAGRRVAVGTRGSGSETLARIVLESYGLPYARIEPHFGSFVDTIADMRRGALDAALIVAGLPAGAVVDLNQQPGIRLLPIPRDHLRTMRALYPFLQPQQVADGTYDGVPATETLGVSSLLVSRDDLDEELAYRLTRTLFEVLPELQKVHPAARLIDPEQAPATPIPLHPGAARYYRERQIMQ